MTQTKIPLIVDGVIQCNEVTAAVLKSGIDVYVGVTMDSDHLSGPEFARFRLDEAFIFDVQKGIDACKACDFDEARTVRSPDEVDAGGNVHMSKWYLSFDKCDAWFKGSSRKGGACKSAAFSPRVLVEMLEQALAGELSDEQSELYGNALFIHDYDLDRLLEVVLAAHPEIEAAESAVQMSKGISETLSAEAAAGDEPVPAATTRRAAI